MIKILRKFLSIIAITLMCGVAGAATNIPVGDIGDHGVWATPHNQELIIGAMRNDVSFISDQVQKQLVADYVPIEAKVGRAFIGAMSMIGQILDRSLVRFATIFIIIVFVFWVMLEAYQMMRATQKSRALIEEIIKKAVLITVWIWIIEQGAAQLFMWIMGPTVSIGTYLSDLILNSVANASGASLPDTCAAIHQYVAQTHTNNAIIDSTAAADLLCVPTRLSGFFYTAVAAGWQWMLAGIGSSAFTFLAGLVFVIIFIYNIYKFALMALGAIADMFIGVMLMPFTAIAETIGKNKMTYDGYAGKIFNEFLKIFETETLEKQIARFLNAIIYFVSLSIVVAVCAAILSGVVDANLAATIPTLENDGFMITLIVGCLVAYLASQAGKIAESFGGKIDDSFGKQVGNDIKQIWKNSSKAVKDWRKAAKSK